MAGRATGGSRKAKKPADPKPKKPRARKSAGGAKAQPKAKPKSSKNDGRSGRRDATKNALIAVDLVQPDPEERKEGRPPEFKVEYIFLVKKLAMLKTGLTNEEIAEFFDKSVATIARWKKDYPEFREAIRDGGVIADMNVADSLYASATGYTFEQEMWTGSGENRKVITRKVRVPGDVTAQRLWLFNRQRDRWADRKDVSLSFNHEEALRQLGDAVGA